MNELIVCAFVVFATSMAVFLVMTGYTVWQLIREAFE